MAAIDEARCAWCGMPLSVFRKNPGWACTHDGLAGIHEMVVPVSVIAAALDSDEMVQAVHAAQLKPVHRGIRHPPERTANVIEAVRRALLGTEGGSE
jgi:hypothetical protein